MNENLQPKMPTFDTWIADASNLLKKAGIETARLDAELILAHTIRQPRTYLHAHGDEHLDERREDIATARLDLRIANTPIAYIVGHRDFYGRQFKTTPAALIPRVESETMIDILIKEIIPKNTQLLPELHRLVDVGTGTGCLGITAKLEWPELDVTLTDISNHALSLAKENAEQLNADVQFFKGDLLHGYSLPVDIILANLPYVDKTWEVSPDTRAEPELALFADDDGLALIKKLILQSATLLKSGGSLLLEADPRQHTAIATFARKNGFTPLARKEYITSFTKV
jgi:release factor glutamine methyltransferase